MDLIHARGEFLSPANAMILTALLNLLLGSVEEISVEIQRASNLRSKCNATHQPEQRQDTTILRWVSIHRLFPQSPSSKTTLACTSLLPSKAGEQRIDLLNETYTIARQCCNLGFDISKRAGRIEPACWRASSTIGRS